MTTRGMSRSDNRFVVLLLVAFLLIGYNVAVVGYMIGFARLRSILDLVLINVIMLVGALAIAQVLPVTTKESSKE